MSKLTITEKNVIIKLFNQHGYVLDFSTAKFDNFTKESIGIPLTEKYNLSKGASLECYISDAEAHEVVHLTEDLLEYALSTDDAFYNKNTNAVNKCKEIISKYKNSSNIAISSNFDSQYISQMSSIMFGSVENNPTEAIGKAKELIESCCKTILDNLGVVYTSKTELSQLIDLTIDKLKLSPKNIPDSAKESIAIKALLGNLRAISSNIATIRNAYGSGHGKTLSYQGLQPRHAKLAVGCSVTLVNFLWDTFESQK